ncbi:MAG: hypothetical protein ACTSO9_17645 [Candidatus Helarchaeota archaeon]
MLDIDFNFTERDIKYLVSIILVCIIAGIMIIQELNMQTIYNSYQNIQMFIILANNDLYSDIIETMINSPFLLFLYPDYGPINIVTGVAAIGILLAFLLIAIRSDEKNEAMEWEKILIESIPAIACVAAVFVFQYIVNGIPSAKHGIFLTILLLAIQNDTVGTFIGNILPVGVPNNAELNTTMLFVTIVFLIVIVLLGVIKGKTEEEKERIRRLKEEKREAKERLEKEKREQKILKEKEKTERLKRSIFESKDTIEELKKMMMVSTRLKFDMMRDALDLDEKSFNKVIVDWAAKYGFTIDGDEVVFSQESKDDFLDDLDAQFREWEEKEKSKEGKI